MSITIILVLLLLFIAATIFKKFRVALFLLLCLFVWTSLVGSGLLTQSVLDNLQTIAPLREVEWKTKNAIVVLGAGTTRWGQTEFVNSHSLGYPRIFEALRLYLDCKKHGARCILLVSGGDPLKHGIAEAEVMRDDLKGVGVNDADIIVESRSNNTYQNAQFSSVIIRANEFDQVVLVTSGFHLRRALAYFWNFKIEGIGAPADRLNAVRSTWPKSANLYLFDLALHEYTGILRLKVYNYLGWNKESSKPGSP